MEPPGIEPGPLLCKSSVLPSIQWPLDRLAGCRGVEPRSERLELSVVAGPQPSGAACGSRTRISSVAGWRSPLELMPRLYIMSAKKNIFSPFLYNRFQETRTHRPRTARRVSTLLNERHARTRSAPGPPVRSRSAAYDRFLVLFTPDCHRTYVPTGTT